MIRGGVGPRFICKACGAESPRGIGYAASIVGPLPAPAAGCRELHDITPGTRVAFGAMRGAVPVTLGGTVVPSRLRSWTKVRTDRGPVVELRTTSLTVTS